MPSWNISRGHPLQDARGASITNEGYSHAPPASTANPEESTWKASGKTTGRSSYVSGDLYFATESDKLHVRLERPTKEVEQCGCGGGAA